ncbi:MAG: redoxin family protein [Bacteroidota bacterium]
MAKKQWVYFFICLLGLQFNSANARNEEPHPSLAIGAKAPDFSLPGIDGKKYSLASFASAKLLVVVFTCNHCPTAQAYENRIIQLTKDYTSKQVAIVAIMPNDPKSIRLDELNYTDVGDSFQDMKIRAKTKGFNFPYLFDGDSQATSKAYGPVATPHVFIFDQNRVLRYSGRIDDLEKPTATPHHFDTRDALDKLLIGEQPTVATTKVFGCSIKWAEKSNWIDLAKINWAKEPVTIDTIGVYGIQKLIKNKTDKLRVINVWATWCGPCVSEFPDFITINRMYRSRDFEWVTISADEPNKQTKVLKFLQKQQASATNYIFNSEDKYQLIEAIDPKWQGAIPYTLVVEPSGKILYAQQGVIDPAELKKIIVESAAIGRYY